MAKYDNFDRNVYPEGLDTRNPRAVSGMQTKTIYELFNGALYRRKFPLRVSIVEGRRFEDIGARFDRTMGESVLIAEKKKPVIVKGSREKKTKEAS